ncbi:hypothetical protein M378DRAFT_214865 [Amanita muscaria Koide BX008]|uniref:Uncharacterized protein n=1 Tax=Amanita muscaria (strain Koide BX008) TaxID=946122 RepID=A0A0C2XQA0_AMAMK|nr:hypothetical protein M378DRAFT_214865 [Amanita muscaria Koide BX008]
MMWVLRYSKPHSTHLQRLLVGPLTTHPYHWHPLSTHSSHLSTFDHPDLTWSTSSPPAPQISQSQASSIHPHSLPPPFLIHTRIHPRSISRASANSSPCRRPLNVARAFQYSFWTACAAVLAACVASINEDQSTQLANFPWPTTRCLSSTRCHLNQ